MAQFILSQKAQKRHLFLETILSFGFTVTSLSLVFDLALPFFFPYSCCIVLYGLVTVTTLYHKAESNKPTTTLAARETLLIKPIMKNCVCLFFMQIIVILLRTFLMDRQFFFPP